MVYYIWPEHRFLIISLKVFSSKCFIVFPSSYIVVYLASSTTVCSKLFYCFVRIVWCITSSQIRGAGYSGKETEEASERLELFELWQRATDGDQRILCPDNKEYFRDIC